jgi:CheY-like chemotaxis protein
MNCPRCKATIGPLANPDGVVTCPGCGSRLMTRSAMLRSQGGQKTGGPAPAPGADASVGRRAARDLPPDATLPATPAQMLALGSLEISSEDPPPASEAAAPSGRKTGAAKRAATPPQGAPAMSGTSQKPATPPAAPAAAAALPALPLPSGAPLAPAAPANPDSSPAPLGPASQETLDLVLRELRFLRELQERILQLLERSPAGGRDSSNDESAEVSPIRARRRKSVVLIDDDPVTREAAVAEMMQADIPVRAFAEGNAAISAIADEKPDVIVLELAIAGSMEGRDVINMVKATMEWVEIPIVLWTRAPVANQREARQIHGADEIVPKANGAAALVARVITLFRRVH